MKEFPFRSFQSCPFGSESHFQLSISNMACGRRQATTRHAMSSFSVCLRRAGIAARQPSLQSLVPSLSLFLPTCISVHFYSANLTSSAFIRLFHDANNQSDSRHIKRSITAVITRPETMSQQFVIYVQF